MSSGIKSVTKSDFGEAVGEGGQPVLVDFWAPWCAPCQALAPELEAAAHELDGKATILKVNVDDEPELAEQFGVHSIPNLIIFKAGKPIRQMIGFHPKSAIVSALV